MKGKRLSAGFGIIVAVILLSGLLNETRGAEWILYEMGQNRDLFYYDKDSVSISDKGVVEVWTKTIFSEKGRDDLIKQFEKRGLSTKGLESVIHSIDKYEIECSNSKYRMVAYVDYGEDGQIIMKGQDDTMYWVDVIPESVFESLMKILCVKPETKGDKSKKKSKQ